MHQKKILLLENVASQAAGVREQLTRAGFKVAVSRYESDGLRRLEEWHPDLVLVSTAHPAGDFVEYCRRARSLAPAARFVVTSSLNRQRLFREHPDLQAIVDGVLLRPYSHEEAIALLLAGPGGPAAPSRAPAANGPAANAPGTDELRVEFQRQLDARFLEVEELRRQLEVASRQSAAAPPGLEWMQSENEHLRQAVKESERKLSLTLATEQLKRSEMEVKLDNLLRMKEDFEFRAQNQIEERTEQIERLQGQLRRLQEKCDGAERAGAERETMSAELEGVLVEKERLEERLHSREAAAAADASRLSALEQEAARCRAAAAEAQRMLAEARATGVALEESLSRERTAREGLARELERERETADAAGRGESEGREPTAAGLRSLSEELAAEREKSAGREGLLEELRRRLAGLESAAAEARGALDAAVARAGALEQELAEERSGRAEDARREQERRREVAAELQAACGQAAGEQAAAAARAQALSEELAAEREKSAGQEGLLEELRRRLAGLESAVAGAQSALIAAEARRSALESELSASGGRIGELAAEGERLQGRVEERERGLAAEVRDWREKAEAAVVELDLLRAQAAERAGREEQERRSLEARSLEAQAAAREYADRLESAEQTMNLERAASRSREEETRLELSAQQALTRELEEKLAESPPVGSPPAELRRIQELLEEVISRARTEAVGNARHEAELAVRIQDVQEERRQLQERFDRAIAEAAERERRSASLLQSLIERGSPMPQGRDNLPAVVPADRAPRLASRRRLLAGLGVAALAVALGFLSLRRASPPPAGVPQRTPLQPAVQQLATPPAGGPAAALSTPQEVWDRWTRSDSSGGVLVQATLRSEQEVRAEVEAERRSRGWGAEQTRAELERRLGEFGFDSAYYATVYLKSLSPGYPAYFEDLVARFRLRDGSGREAPAFLPPGQEKDRRIFTFGTGPPSSRIYEATIPLGFSRAELSRSPGYLQLVVSDVGAASRRVLTWELE